MVDGLNRGRHSDEHERGDSLRRQVMGDSYVDAAADASDLFGAPFQRFLTESCWGATWGREALDLEVRSLITVCILAATGRVPELELHVRGALRNGVEPDQLLDAYFHVASYAGVPAAVEAVRATRRVLAELERDGDG